MSDYRRILIAVDLSPDSALIFDKARAIGCHKAELSLIHVMEPFPAGFTAGYEELCFEMARQHRGALLELGGTTGIPAYRLHSVIGDPAHEIRAMAKTIDADLIVVGGHGKHGFELLLGSTSTAVAHGVECDLLIVRAPKRQQPAAQTGSSQAQR